MLLVVLGPSSFWNELLKVNSGEAFLQRPTSIFFPNACLQEPLKTKEKYAFQYVGFSNTDR